VGGDGKAITALNPLEKLVKWRHLCISGRGRGTADFIPINATHPPKHKLPFLLFNQRVKRRCGRVQTGRKTERNGIAKAVFAGEHHGEKCYSMTDAMSVPPSYGCNS
jgi:hypothetical protein